MAFYMGDYEVGDILKLDSGQQIAYGRVESLDGEEVTVDWFDIVKDHSGKTSATTTVKTTEIRNITSNLSQSKMWDLNYYKKQFSCYGVEVDFDRSMVKARVDAYVMTNYRTY